MSKRDAVLIIGGGLLQAPMALEAQRLGLLPIVTDGNPQAPAFAHAYEHHILSTSDVEGHVRLVESLRQWEPTTGVHIIGVVTCGADVAPTVAAAAHAAGTPRIPLEVARMTHDKAAVRIALDTAGLARYQPRWLWRRETCTRHLEAEVAETCSYPCVVKPVEQRASRGISLVQERQALSGAIRKAFEYGATYLIEEQLRGTEHSVEGIFDTDGALLWLNIVDRFFDYSSGVPIETGHVNPGSLVPRIGTAVDRMFGNVAHALGVTWGPFKMDTLVTPEGHPKVLECTARLSGGWDCQGTSPMTARNPMRALLQLACGLPVDAPLTWKPLQGYSACAAILPQVTGMVRALPARWPQMVMSYPQEVMWTIRPGDTIAPATHNGERAGFVLAHAQTYADAWHRAKSAADALADAVEVIP